MISLDYKGFYWEKFDENQKPINPKECQIVFSPKEGGKLLYFLNVDEDISYDEIKDKKIKVLYGQVADGGKFTLYNLKFEIARHFFKTNIKLTEVKYSIQYIFHEGWVDIDSKLQIMHVRFSYLELWLNQLKIQDPLDDDNKTMAGFMVHKETLAGSSEKYEVLFNINNGFSQSSFNNKIITYEATNSLAIAKKEDFYIEEAVSLSLIVKKFFEVITFYSQNKIFIEKFYLTQKRKLKDGYEVDEIVYLLFKQDDYIEEQKMSHLDFLFRYSDVKENFVEILNNWIENHDKNKNEYQAFCNVIADKTSKFNIYSHYFQLISALEAYHRLQNKDIEEQEEQKHNSYLESLKTQLSCLNSNEKKKILYKLQYAYGINFKDRLKNLVEISEIKEVILCDDSFHDNIIEFIYKMRNKVAHLKNEIKVSQQLKSSFEYLKLVALLIMLKDISLSHAKIHKNIFDMDIKYMQKKLIEAFGDKEGA
ncbi:MAG: HEPN domain-containing protein [Campylobacterota bacterium]